VRASEVQMRARSQATPLILGQKGSALDLVMNTLYFAANPPEIMSHCTRQNLEHWIWLNNMGFRPCNSIFQ
ncbi:hypothetical protein C2W62_53480, partial [Candidatus Entotheonella serta]